MADTKTFMVTHIWALDDTTDQITLKEVLATDTMHTQQLSWEVAKGSYALRQEVTLTVEPKVL